MDKTTAIAGGVLGVAVAGGLLYYFLVYKKQTTTTTTTQQSYTVTLINNCNQTINVTYTDPNGNTKTITILPGQGPSINVMPNSQISYVLNGQTQIAIANQNNQIIYLCSASTVGAYTAFLVNDCSISIIVNYNAPSGGVNSITIKPGQAQTIQVLANSQISYVLNGQWQNVTIDQNNQTVYLCGLLKGQVATVELYNACNQGLYVHYTDTSGNKQVAYAYPASWLTLQTLQGSTITVYDSTGQNVITTFTVSSSTVSLTVKCSGSTTPICHKIGNQLFCTQ